jgi:hypothetical protein
MGLHQPMRDALGAITTDDHQSLETPSANLIGELEGAVAPPPICIFPVKRVALVGGSQDGAASMQ